MKLAFSKVTTTEEQATLLKQQFHTIGFDGLQLKGNQYMPHVETPEAFLEAWPAPGVASALITGGPLNDKTKAKLTQIYGFAEAVDCERIVFCHSQKRDGVNAADLRTYATALSEEARKAADHGLAFSLHHHHNQPVMHREDFDIFFEAAAGVGLTLDTAHLVKSGIQDIAEVIRSFASVIDNYHLKDIADGEWQILGEGGIDFASVFSAIAETGYRGWVSCDEESGADVAPAMKTCYDFMARGIRSCALPIQGDTVPEQHTAWGTLAWPVSGFTPATGMTVGRVTFGPGQANPPHAHPNCDEVLHVIRGRLEHSLPQGGTAILQAGDSICLPRGRQHHARNVTDEEAEVLVCFNTADRQTVCETS